MAGEHGTRAKAAMDGMAEKVRSPSKGRTPQSTWHTSLKTPLLIHLSTTRFFKKGLPDHCPQGPQINMPAWVLFSFELVCCRQVSGGTRTLPQHLSIKQGVERWTSRSVLRGRRADVERPGRCAQGLAAEIKSRVKTCSSMLTEKWVPTQSMQQMWTFLQHDGPDRLGLWSVTGTLRRRWRS